MNDIKLEITDYYILLNLHKALLEAKFHVNPDNMLVCRSPIIADLYNELLDILGRMDDIKDKKNIGKWDNWRKLENQSYNRTRAKKLAILNSRWAEMNYEEKMREAKNLLSPFKATDEELVSFINDVDEEFLLKDKTLGD